jgi:small subunit ribosomal protein S2
MAPYIFMERNGIHIIDLEKTAAKIEEARTLRQQSEIQIQQMLLAALLSVTQRCTKDANA